MRPSSLLRTRIVITVVMVALAGCQATETESAANHTTTTGTGAANMTCQELPDWGPPVGIFMGVLGSIGINIGQNLQADGLRDLPESLREKKPWASKKWLVGQAVFVSFSILNFAALALAPASVLVPLEAIQFISLSHVCAVGDNVRAVGLF